MGSAESVPTDGVKQVRDMYLQSMSQQAEQFMRSPQFLEMMKKSTENAVALRQQTNDMLAQAHHAVGSVARTDMDSLLMAIRRCETRVLDKLDDLSARLDALEKGGGAAKAPARKRVRRTK